MLGDGFGLPSRRVPLACYAIMGHGMAQLVHQFAPSLLPLSPQDRADMHYLMLYRGDKAWLGVGACLHGCPVPPRLVTHGSRPLREPAALHCTYKLGRLSVQLRESLPEI